MDWMVCYGMLCVCFYELLFGMLCVISVWMNYFFVNVVFVSMLKNFKFGYVSCYVLGCDYYKFLCNWFKKLGEMI